MASVDRETLELVRTRLLAIVMLAALMLLVIVMWRVQVRDVSTYVLRLDRQTIRRVRLPGTRGRILDRNGTPLADNRLSFCIAIYVEELRQSGRRSNTVDRIEAVIAQVGDIVETAPSVTREDISAHLYKRQPLPFLAWRDLSREAVARWAEQGEGIPGVDLYVEPIRVYPQDRTTAHLIGYVRRADPDPTGERYHFYLPEMEGRDGIERSQNELLSGQAGGRLIRVDASGYKHAEAGERQPVPGEDVHLTIDLRIQEAALRQLASRRGAAVVMDPRNGDVLALATSPTYSIDILNSTAAWKRVSSSPDHPLLNRAIAGRYPPGSTFKPLVATAALEGDVIDGESIIDCPSYYMVGKRKIKCWSSRGHGPLALRKALEQSCNPFFCALGAMGGYDRIRHMAAACGFGERTGIELPGESSGLLPDDEWKRRIWNDGWRQGDTCNVSIGQGALLATPLQMAMYTAALANGGYVMQPRLIGEAGTPGKILNRMGWSEQTVSLVRGGMYDVVQAEFGTGKRALIKGVAMGGKTGTAQYVDHGEKLKHGWMILFAPYDEPRYAIAMVVENAVGGGITVAPRIRQLMVEILKLDGTLPPDFDLPTEPETGEAG
jgi:penicillin-binding protein 2